MEPERHALAKQFFGEVCDLPLDQQGARLRQLTGDAEIITFVELLLRQTATDNERVSQPILRAMIGIAGNEIEVGDTLGAWKLAEKIGQGGMGAVFRARRSDGHFDQDAAIKLLHGIPSAKALEYLARERQILATLTHPNIARLYDGGATPHGQPYLVMEYVEGIAIDRYCREKTPPVRGILKLMLDVCDAISFAHQRLVVHCDIKPSNILVTSTGRPMLLDFGIARLLDGEVINESAPDQPESSAQQASSKLTVARAFTPQYASPEQRSGQALTTATDVYSLGKMLDELLITHRAGKAAIDTELRAIIGKATENDTARRYATASALASDLDRYLHRLPLIAIPATAGYVAQKFVQRNWPWLAAAGVFTFTVGIGATRIVTERDRAQTAEQQALKERDRAQAARTEAERERDRVAAAERATSEQRDRATAAEGIAVTQRDRAKLSEASAVAEKIRATHAEAASRQTSEFLVSVFDSSNPNAESGDIPASKLIAAAQARVETQMQGQPETQASLYTALGRVQSNMGRPNEARTNYRRAIEMERKQNRPLELAKVLTLEFQNDVLKLDNSNMLPLAREALALREKFAPPESPEIAQSLAFVAYALRATSGNLDEAEKLIVRSLAIYEKTEPDGLGMAEAQHVAGQVYGVRGQRDHAIASYRRSVAIKQTKLGEGHPDVILSLQYLAGDLNRARQFVEAEAIFRRIVAQNEKLHGRQNVNMLRPLIYLCTVLTTTGRPRESLPLAREALQIAEKTVGRDSTYAALALSSIGVALSDMGDGSGAAAASQEALGIMKKYMRPVDNAIAEQEFLLGRALGQIGKHAEAEPHLLAAHATYSKVLGDSNRLTALVVAHVVRNAIAQDKLTDAATWQARLKPPQSIADKDVIAEIAMANVIFASTRPAAADSAKDFLATEQLYRELYGEADARTWLAMLPRCEWLTRRGAADEDAGRRGRMLAAEIASRLREKLVPEAPVLARLKQLQAI